MGRLDDDLDAVLIGGREPVTIKIADYDPGWPARFAVERDRIAGAPGAQALGIEHIGSAAVPGLAAKPIVDVLVELADLGDEAAYVTQRALAGRRWPDMNHYAEAKRAVIAEITARAVAPVHRERGRA